MKKTLNINIGNSIIHLEEDAYELLTNYLMEVKTHFGKSADDFEIVNDIENRIAEMFIDMLRTQEKQVIELEDVQVVISLMGSVKDFEEQPEEEPVTGQQTHAAYAERKIYRDTEDTVVAGVCSGLSHYLRVDVSILRVIAVLSVLLGGSGLIAYLILWIVLPQASSRAEKMAMKGEAVNLQGFKRNFEEELSGLKGNLQQAGDNLQPLIKRSGSFISEFIAVLSQFFHGAGRRIFKLIAVVIAITGSLLLVAALIAVAAVMGFYDGSINEVFPINILDVSYSTGFIISVFIVFVIPLFALILFSIKIAFNTTGINKTVSYGLLLIWLGGLSAGIFYVAKITSEFKEEATFAQTIPVKPYSVYHLTLDNVMTFSKEDSLQYQLNAEGAQGRIIKNDRNGLFDVPRNVRITIERTEGTVPSIVKSYRSSGVNFETALYNAKNIQYNFIQQDSVLKFSPEIELKNKVNWRDQRVEIVFKVPVGVRVDIDRALDRYLQDYSLWDCGDEENGDGPYQGIMTSEGLKCRIEQ